MGSQSNTMIFSEKAGDFNALVAQAASVFQQSNKVFPQNPDGA